MTPAHGSPAHWCATLGLGFFAGLAGFAVFAHLVLQTGGLVPGAAWPVSMGLGIAGAIVVGRVTTGVGTGETAAAPRSGGIHAWIPSLAGALILGCLGLTVWGSLSSLDREWDGFASWSYRARYLRPPVDLDQPFFTDPAVVAPGPAYPLLQPLCLGTLQAWLGERLGRVWFPLLYLAAISTLGSILHRAGSRRSMVWSGMAAFASTPMWLNRGAGSVDSGYAEIFVAATLIVGAGGLILRDGKLLFLATLLLPLIKPEGLVYAIWLGAVTALAGRRPLHAFAAVGLALGGGSGLPLQAQLGGGSVLAAWSIALGAGLATWVGGEVCFRLRPGRGWRAAALAVVAGVSILIAWLLAPHWAGSSVPLLRDFAGNLGGAGERLAKVGELLGGIAAVTFAPNRFGLLFVLVVAVLILGRRQDGAPQPALTAFLIGGVATAWTALLLAPIADLHHELHARFDRLLLHWTGIGWLLVCLRSAGGQSVKPLSARC